MSMIEHIVLLKLKDGVSEDKMKALLAGINDLKKVIPGMLEVSGGYNNSIEGKAGGGYFLVILLFYLLL